MQKTLGTKGRIISIRIAETPRRKMNEKISLERYKASIR